MAMKAAKERKLDALCFTKQAKAEELDKTTSLVVGNRAQRNRGKRAGD